MTTSTQEMLMVATLQVAVPLWIADLAAFDPTNRADANLLKSWRKQDVDTLACTGDLILYRGGKSEEGGARRAFNAMARGIAMLSSSPGGCFVFGLIWCARHSPSGQPPTADWDRVCPQCCAEDLLDAVEQLDDDEPARPVVTATLAGDLL